MYALQQNGGYVLLMMASKPEAAAHYRVPNERPCVFSHVRLRLFFLFCFFFFIFQQYSLHMNFNILQIAVIL